MLKELMQLCWNAGWEGFDGNTSFADWWDKYGKDRHEEFQGEDDKALDIIKGLYGSLATVIQSANDRGSDFSPASAMKWGRRSLEFVAKMEENDDGK